MLTLGSLFDGIGGFPLAGVMCGVRPVWSSEIEPFPLKVTAARFPDMKQLGSVTDIDGGAAEPVDIISFGSPCQDLSVAGKQLGIHEGQRSNLFFEAVRIIKEMRKADEARGRTDKSIRPRFAVWENVPGAFSSNNGADFKAVLEALAGVIEADVSIPQPKRWDTGGGYRGKRLEPGLAGLRRSILGSAPAPQENLPCRRFCRRTRRRNTICHRKRARAFFAGRRSGGKELPPMLREALEEAVALGV